MTTETRSHFSLLSWAFRRGAAWAAGGAPTTPTTVIPAAARSAKSGKPGATHAVDISTHLFSFCSPHWGAILLASRRNGTLYYGVTNNLVHRLWQHRNGQGSAFAAKYNVSMLVWFEEHGDIRAAMHRETLIKRWRREWKLKLIEDFNPNWRDLYEDLLPGAARSYDKPPVVDHSRANPSRFDSNDPFLRSFNTSERLAP